MLRLDRHIESLLTKYDCVILPGFGGFVTYHVSARIDEVGDVMLPPSTTVGFNPQLTLNDSLLVQSYVETYDYSFPEALHIVADEIRELESILQENGHYELPSIGQLTINIKGKYEFEPTPSGILIPEFYALPNIDIANKQDPVQSDFESDRQSGAQSGSDDDKVIKIRVRTLRRVAAIFIAILLISSIPFLSRNTSTNEILSSIDPFSRISGPTPRMSVSSPVLPDLQGSSKREQSSLSELPSVAETRHSQSDYTGSRITNPTERAEQTERNERAERSAEPQQVYAVVLAARISIKNATLFVEKLHREGITSARVIGEGKSRKVVCGSFGSEEEAQQERKVIASAGGFPDAWVLKIKES